MKTKLSLQTLIKSLKFDWVNSDITKELFPAPKDLRTDFKLYHFDKLISSEDAIIEMQKDGYAPANIYELLEYAKASWNNNDLIVALGTASEVDGDCHVPSLDGDGSERDLDLSWWVGGWSSRFRFLAVRNSETGTLESGPLDTLTLESAIEMVKKGGYVIYKLI